jgi:hypothetical protein
MATQTKPNQASQGKQAAAPPARAFRVGVQSHEENNFDTTVTLGTSTIDLPVFELPPQGFLQGIYALFQMDSATNAATVAYTNLDAPFNVIDTIQLEDTNSKPIIGPFGGFELYLINKYGGYAFGSDPKESDMYQVTVGATTPYKAYFVLRLPVELVARDALGALPNKSGTNKFRIRTRIAASATVFSVAPTNAVTCRVRYAPENWWEPDMMDLKGRPLGQNPPAVQTTQYWTKGVYAINAGDQRVQIQQGLGYLIRNYIFVNRTTGDARTSAQDAFWPSPATLQFEANVLFDRLRELWQDRIFRLWDYNKEVALSDVVATGTGATRSGGGRDYCVYPLPFNQDFGLQPGAETRRGYLATADASRMELRGNFGGAANLSVIANYVAPAKGDDALITS